MSTTQTLSDPVTVLDCLGDEYSVRILSALSDRAMSAKGISEELDIPIATVYRRIETLDEAGLIEYEGKALTDDDKRVKVYRSYIDELRVFFEPDEPQVEMKKYSDAQSSIDAAWKRIKR
ncbi:MAG: helix-turn-helix domain-containing protein [Halobacteriales archaeon]|nr:helix-turn-helix domain-containing protein [Halobacteriales archaeon]